MTMARLLTTALAVLAATASAAAPAAAKDKSNNGGSNAQSSNASSNGAAGVPSNGEASSPDWGSAINLVTAECQLTGGCLFSGNDQSGSAIAEAYTEVFPLSQISLSLVGKVEFAGSQYSGGWTSDTAVSFLSVKAGNQFMLYSLDAPATAGTWSTAGLINNQQIAHAVSHISLWSGAYQSGVTQPTQDPPIVTPFEGGLGGLSLAIPEPATWISLLLGFGAIGAALRRRRLATAA
jgi:hypothetical protein